MQITIVQAEIEQAIIAQIKSQVAIKEDQEITVDLRATRGAEGYQAIIDIRPKLGGSTEEAPAASLTPSPKPLGIEKAVEDAKPAAKADDKPKSAAKAVAEPVLKTEVPEPAAAEKEVTLQPEPEAQTAVAARSPLFTPKAAAAERVGGAEDVPAPVQSIFGSLKKPVNN